MLINGGKREGKSMRLWRARRIQSHSGLTRRRESERREGAAAHCSQGELLPEQLLPWPINDDARPKSGNDPSQREVSEIWLRASMLQWIA